MITPNTTCDIYRCGNAPPAAPDVAAVPCYFTPCFDLGQQRGKHEPQPFHFCAILKADAATDVRDGFDAFTGTNAAQDTVYIPDQNGIAYAVVFVEKKSVGTAAQCLAVYLERKAVNWPWPAAPGQPGAILPPPPAPTPPTPSPYLPLTGGTMTGIITLASESGGIYDTYGNPPTAGMVLQLDPLGHLLWQYPQYANGSPLTDSDSYLYYPYTNTVLADTTGYLYYPSGEQLADFSSNLYIESGVYYPDSSTFVDSGSSIHLNLNAGRYSLLDCANQECETIGQYLSVDSSGQLILWQFPQYANGNPLVDSDSNLYLPTAYVYDSTGSVGYGGMVLQPSGSNSQPVWQYPVYANGNPLVDINSYLYYYNGNIFLGDDGAVYYNSGDTLVSPDSPDLNLALGGSFRDSAGESGLAGQVFIIDATTSLPIWAYPHYPNGGQLTDFMSNLFLSSTGRLYDSVGSYGSAGQVLTISPTTGLPVWN